MSSQTMSRRVVVAFPRIHDESAWRDVVAIRDQFDPLAARVQPHLTLAFPFEDAMSDADLQDHLRSVMGDAPTFPIMLREVTAHEGEYLFLNVKQGNDELIHLHDVIYSGRLRVHRRRTHTYVPHVTVGRLTPANLARGLDLTAEFATSTIHATISAISVYLIESDGNRPILFDVPLRPTSP